ncbi:futalosine hydrolase [Parasediminibacterium paludis]|uniref:Futalosine hydrolase n=1 Tax=Parasediminibacterium paludis TaxID=908966 RepID=A0ABV8PZJ0_9BACT
MKIIVAAATSFEIQPTINTSVNSNVQFLVTGIGMLATAVSITQLVLQQQPSIIIQAGIAGTFNTNLPLGKVVAINSETIGDLGVQENDRWKDVFDLKLIDANSAPFTNKQLLNPYLAQLNPLGLEEVPAITVNEISTNQQRISQLRATYNPTIESMEGAALHYICNSFHVPYIQLRSISNYIGERDKNKWQMQQAITNLNEALKAMLQQLLS